MTEEIKTTVKPAEQVDQPQQQPSLVLDAVKAAEEMKKQVELMKAEHDRADKRFALQQLGGTAEAGIPPVPAKIDTPIEYADKLLKGEVNPFKEDGFK